MRAIDALTMEVSNIAAIGPNNSSEASSSSCSISELDEWDNMLEYSGILASYLGFLSFNQNFLLILNKKLYNLKLSRPLVSGQDA